jgi:hypothetical protein
MSQAGARLILKSHTYHDWNTQSMTLLYSVMQLTIVSRIPRVVSFAERLSLVKQGELASPS